MKVNQADRWFSLCVRHAAGWQCEKCGKVYPENSMGLHNSHNFSRRHRTIRWCADNTLALCYPCHQWFGGNPADSGEWLRQQIGDGMLDLLREKRDSMVKVSKAEEKEIAAHYRKEYRRMVETGSREFESWQ